MGMAHAEVLSERQFGESHFSVREQFRRFTKDPEGEMKKRYRFVKTWDEFLAAIEDAKAYKAELEEEAKKAGKELGGVWLVLDDSYRWRVFAVLRWLELQSGKTRKSGKDIKWPAEAEWGLVSQLMTDTMNILHNDFNLVLIHRMKDEYIKNVATGETIIQAFPGGINYTGDITIEVAKEDKEGTGKKRRVYKVIWNRFEDDCSEESTTRIEEDVSPIELMLMLKTPGEYI